MLITVSDTHIGLRYGTGCEMKQFELVSDLHLDFYGEVEACDIINSWTAQTPTLVIAGDLCEMRHFNPAWIHTMKRKWNDIVYVPGNHDYYGRSLDPNVLDALRFDCHVLTRNRLAVNGIVFAGATLWFPHPLRNRKYERLVSDFSMIGPYGGIDFYEDVENENRKDHDFFHWIRADVWVTHHLPFAQSIHPKYAGAQSNLFFHGAMEEVLNDCERAPQVVVHGHTHESVEYSIDLPRGFGSRKLPVHCNPMGYPGERYGEYKPKLIEF